MIPTPSTPFVIFATPFIERAAKEAVAMEKISWQHLSNNDVAKSEQCYYLAQLWWGKARSAQTVRP